MNNRLRISIPVIGGKHWLGGITYVHALASALKSLPDNKRPLLQLVIRPHDIASMPYHQDTLESFDRVILIGEATMIQTALPSHLKAVTLATQRSLARETDFYYPVNCDVLPDLCSASWIPDFQHIHLPQFFLEQEIRLRNESFSRIAAEARAIVFSSKNAQQDFKLLFPESRAKTQVLHFHTQIDEKLFSGDVDSIRQLYRLPAKYVICCNQFWKHKNHLLLFEAVARLRDQSVFIPLICTGSTEDYRFAGYFQQIRERIKQLQLQDQVRILGTIPRNHQLQLIRCAALLVQPSLFEGWSTVVEDGRALGKKMLLSDLEVHREQATGQTTYFDRSNAQDLQNKLLTIWKSSEAGPVPEVELQARITARIDQQRFASDLMKLAEDTIRQFNGNSPAEKTPLDPAIPNLQHLLQKILT
ncbi:glycosyltransferase family 4 protein [bacterium]|nr:glycosyltransferase family 4 protein [bacterium]